ncbi:MAG: cytochrome-c oxidase, cbb3-type subunit I [Candidatus Didemnitutus sp.]|nr:cytochrome-c oxidase, cbb3-type subunit I [Candidatus Didemnitutus sp.]
MQGHKITIEFNDKIVRQFMLASILWGIVGMLVGVLVATQLNFWQANFNTAWLTFGRLRPLHTNAVIFAFVGNMMFAGVYYSLQRLVKARLASDFLSALHFWGWQAIIVSAAITLPLGLTRGKEYAELIWPINIAVAVIWVVFAVNFFWTLAKRNEKSLYVAIWFYIATIITVAMLYIVNHLSIPTSWVHSYPVFGGVQDALVQWWYGHNAVAFFLTTPILGIMYYFLPKAAGRPIYSYRWSVIHFWSLVFLYIWAGPHHLLNTALPNWLQMLGVTFSLMLWAPSWAGMLNGLLTLRGAWDRLRTDPIIKFFAAGVTFYGMATFEGPLLSIKSVNALAHYTDWIVGHVHAGALGWNGFMAAGMFYWLVPRLWNRPLYSTSLANLHFWLGTFGMLLYVGAMWASGISQGLMLNATIEGGTILKYPNFIETLNAIRPLMLLRVVGGSLYLVGFMIMAWNIWQSIRGAQTVNGTIEVYPEAHTAEEKLSVRGTIANAPIVYTVITAGGAIIWMFTSGWVNILGLFGTVAVALMAFGHYQTRGTKWGEWYDRLLMNALPFTVLTFVAVAAGGLIQIIPMILVDRHLQTEDRVAEIYTPLELAGRDIYVREGCYNCHSQMIRTLVPDVMRYGDYSRLGESIWDHPYQWGSKRTGPDLARIGGRYNHAWHYDHMLDPRSISTGSNMPNYPVLTQNETDYASLARKVSVQRTLGVPYPSWSDTMVNTLAREQAKEIARDLQAQGRYVDADKEIIALTAYLQSLGQKSTSLAPPR